MGHVSEFDDIRPYEDHEIPAAVQRLIRDPEMANLLLQLRYPGPSRWFGAVLRPLVRWRMQKALGHIRTVREFQLLVGVHMEKLLAEHGSVLSVSGLEQLPSDQAHLFMSNHRDIAMDPALVDLVLDRHGHKTVRIAIGDNLLSKPFVSDLMRINKSFIVKRSVQGRREKLQALTLLSRYIRHSVTTDREPVWIAQREGRAKDGRDRTETALLKMLTLSKARGEEFGAALASLNIVPVAISYELDPCDVLKARELHALRTTGEYRKSQYEDIESIYRGIFGNKGRIHVAFGTPLGAACASDDLAAAEIDRQIATLYRLQVSNLVAWREQGGDMAVFERLRDEPACSAAEWAARERVFLERLAQCPSECRDLFLAMYANPVQTRLDFEGREPLGGVIASPAVPTGDAESVEP